MKPPRKTSPAPVVSTTVHAEPRRRSSVSPSSATAPWSPSVTTSAPGCVRRIARKRRFGVGLAGQVEGHLRGEDGVGESGSSSRVAGVM